MLLTFRNIGPDTFERTLRAGQDLAEVMGTDLKSAMLVIGKVSEDPIEGLTMLKRAGVALNETETEMIRKLAESGRELEAVKLILKGVEDRVGGAGAASAQGLTGAFHRAGEAWEELVGRIGKSDLGKAVGDAVDEASEAMERLNRQLAENQDLSDFPLTLEVRRQIASIEHPVSGMGEATPAQRRARIAEIEASPEYADEQRALKARTDPTRSAELRGYRAPPTPPTLDELGTGRGGFMEGSSFGLHLNLIERGKQEAKEAEKEAERARALRIELAGQGDRRAGLFTSSEADLVTSRKLAADTIAEQKRNQEQALDSLRGYHQDRLRAEENNLQLIIEAERERLAEIETLLDAGVINEQQAAEARRDVQIKASKDIAAEQERQAERAAQAWGSSLRGMMGDLDLLFDESKRGWEKYGQFALNIIEKIAVAAATQMGGGKAPYDQAGGWLAGVLGPLLGGGAPAGTPSAGTTSGFSALLSGLSGIMAPQAGAPSGGIWSGPWSAFADGGTVGPFEPSIIGERGPEPFFPAVGGRIISHEDALAALGGGKSAGPTISTTVTFNVSPGVPEAARQEIAKATPGLVRQVEAAVMVSLSRNRAIRRQV